MNKRLLENYIRNALLTEQQRIDENRLLTLGLAGLMSATAFVGSISDSLAKDLNIPGVEQVQGREGVYKINGKTFNAGYFLKKGKLKINRRQVKGLVHTYGPVIHKVLSALTKNSPQLRARTKNLDTRKYRGTRKLKRRTIVSKEKLFKAFEDFEKTPEQQAEFNKRLEKSLNELITYAENLGLTLSYKEGGSRYFIVYKGSKNIASINPNDIDPDESKMDAVKKQLDYMAEHG